MNRKRIGKRESASSSWEAKESKLMITHTLEQIQKTIDELGWNLKAGTSYVNINFPSHDPHDVASHGSVHWDKSSVCETWRDMPMNYDVVCTWYFPFAQEGPPESKGSDISDEDWQKVELTTQDLEKVTKQGEQVLGKQSSKDANKELKELMDKLATIITDNKQIEAHTLAD